MCLYLILKQPAYVEGFGIIFPFLDNVGLSLLSCFLVLKTSVAWCLVVWVHIFPTSFPKTFFISLVCYLTLDPSLRWSLCICIFMISSVPFQWLYPVLSSSFVTSEFLLVLSLIHISAISILFLLIQIHVLNL